MTESEFRRKAWFNHAYMVTPRGKRIYFCINYWKFPRQRAMVRRSDVVRIHDPVDGSFFVRIGSVYHTFLYGRQDHHPQELCGLKHDTTQHVEITWQELDNLELIRYLAGRKKRKGKDHA